MVDPWSAIYTVLLPVLAGLALLAVLRRLLAFWQVERGVLAVATTLVYFSLFVLFLLFALYGRMAPLVSVQVFIRATTIAYLLLGGALTVTNWYEWRTLWGQLRRKDAAHLEPVDTAVVTLKEVASADVAVALEATDKGEGV